MLTNLCYDFNIKTIKVNFRKHIFKLKQEIVVHEICLRTLTLGPAHM